MIHLDIEYVRKKTLWMDLRIILMTIPALIAQVQGMRKKKAAALAALTENGDPNPNKQSAGLK